MGHTHRYKFGFKKKKKSQCMVLHPELGSDMPIGSDRESGRNRLCSLHLGFLLVLTFPIIYFSFMAFLEPNVCNFLWDGGLKGKKAKKKTMMRLEWLGII